MLSQKKKGWGLMHKIFTYGTLKQGFNNHGLLHSSEFLGKAETADKYMLIDYGLPILLKYKAKLSQHIDGELYLVDDGILQTLDTLEGHPFLYKRELSLVKLENGQIDEAFIYFFQFNKSITRHLDDIQGLKSWSKS
jgi:gamma-glutamylaminecyclotransferase